MISAALAVPPLVSTTTGRFGHGCGFASRYVLDVVGARPRVSTTSCPGSRNSSLTATPWSSKPPGLPRRSRDRKSTRLNSSHGYISYAVFCLKKKKKKGHHNYKRKREY